MNKKLFFLLGAITIASIGIKITAKAEIDTQQKHRLEAIVRTSEQFSEIVRQTPVLAKNKAGISEADALFVLGLTCRELNGKSMLKEVSLKPNEKVVVASDVHGDLPTTVMARNRAKEGHFLVLGDLVDRGLCSTEVVVYLLACQLLDPEHVTILQGDHENSEDVQGRYGFGAGILRKYNLNKNLWEQFFSTFKYLPFASTIQNGANQKLFCCHGGIGESTNVASIKQLLAPVGSETWENLEPFKENSAIPYDILQGVLWSDPEPGEPSYSLNHRRGIGYYFGENAFQQFCENNQVSGMIRGHSHDGFKQNFQTSAGQTCWTVSSSPNIYRSCFGGRVEPGCLATVDGNLNVLKENVTQNEAKETQQSWIELSKDRYPILYGSTLEDMLDENGNLQSMPEKSKPKKKPQPCNNKNCKQPAKRSVVPTKAAYCGVGVLNPARQAVKKANPVGRVAQPIQKQKTNLLASKNDLEQTCKDTSFLTKAIENAKLVCPAGQSTQQKAVQEKPKKGDHSPVQAKIPCNVQKAKKQAIQQVKQKLQVKKRKP